MNAEASLATLARRADEMIEALAAITAVPGQMTRLYLTPEHKRAAALVAQWMADTGLMTGMDAAGTVHGLLPARGDDPGARRRLLVGSHIDTVKDAGKYDGNLGVIAGILAADEIRRRGIQLPFDLEILAFGDEEGVRFPTTLISSSAIAGCLTPHVLDMVDEAGISLRQALTDFGCDPAALHGIAYSAEAVLGYLEVHIEQGPVLEAAGEPLGVVSAIAGQGRYRVHVSGEAGHAGTVPMGLRRDALAGAAEMMGTVEDVARAGAENAMVGTVGDIRAYPGAGNVIAGSVVFSLDLRSDKDAARAAALADIKTRVEAIAARRGLSASIETMHEKPVAHCATRMQAALSRGIEAVTGRAPRTLVSGAGHDGQAMSQLTEFGMMFVRCRGGISHNPLEYAHPDDMALAVEALVQSILALADEHQAKAASHPGKP